jgi:dicarboxylate transporter DctA-like protein
MYPLLPVPTLDSPPLCLPYWGVPRSPTWTKMANFIAAVVFLFCSGGEDPKMATVTVEPLEHSSTPRRWSRGRAMLLVLGAAIGLALLFHFIVMPSLVRARVAAALRDADVADAGFTVSRATLWGAALTDVRFAGGGAARVEIGYGPRDLWHGRIDTLRVTSLRYEIESPGPATTNPSRPLSSHFDLPVRKIELADSKIVLPGDRPVEIPLQASLEKQGTRYAATLTAGEADALSVHASLGQTLRDGNVRASVRGVESELLMRGVRLLAGDVGLNLGGELNGDVAGEWSDVGGRVYGRISLSDGTKTGGGKLNLWGGVYSGEARFGPSTRPTMTLKVEDAGVATADLVAEGVTGTVSFSDLAPPATSQPRELSASRLKIGDMELTDGRIEFEVKPGGEVLVRQTNWNWLGGELFASNFAIPRVGPMTVTVRLRDVELAQVLNMLAEKKASGQGRLSGELPVTVDGPRVHFGNGTLTANAGGNLQIKDAATLAPAAEAARAVAAAGASQEQIKNDIIQALSDFQYDRLTGRLVNEPDGLAAYVRMSGRGRTGARQALDYELRVHGVDAVLRSYTSYREATNLKSPTTGKAGP